ncbi:MAG: GTPase ObgE, partial [Haemophilus parainfluenzae]|nr:GTPase ObgE [Haemophilus parainfluenzae]
IQPLHDIIRALGIPLLVIEGASDGAGLGIRFLKHLERCRVLIHLVDINPIDESDPADNIAIIESELFQYSEKLADKPRWLVFNKIDTMTEEEAHERAQEITERLGWEEGYHLISAATGKNVPPLCRDIMDFIEANPRNTEVEENKPEEVKFKWEDYHQEQLAEHQFDDEDDDWDDWEEDEEGVEFIYKP